VAHLGGAATHRGPVGADEIGVEHPDLLASGEPLVVDVIAAVTGQSYSPTPPIT